MLSVILLLCGNAFGQTYYNLGDCNSDGWCNWADVYTLTEFFRGTPCPNYCPSAFDANGVGGVNGVDVVYLMNFLNLGGPPPVHACPCPVMTCDKNESAYIELKQISDANPLTATFRASIMSSATLAVANFSLIYDPAIISGFAPAAAPPPLYPVRISASRLFVAPANVIAVTFDCYNGGTGATFPVVTPVFDLVLSRVPAAPNTDIKVIENDPIYGPPRFFFGSALASLGCGSIFPFSPLQMVGDVNGNGTVNGIDVVYFVNYLKGGPKPIGKYFWNLPVDWNY
jgi:hypothetical protein